MDQRIDDLIRFGRAASDAGLMSSTCGNASLRLDGDRMLITASGAPLAALTPDVLSVVALEDGVHLTGPHPSMEAEIHRRAYLRRPDANAVLHCQSQGATLLACMQDPPRNLDLIPEIPAYVRRHAYAPWAAPGSLALADGVEHALLDPDVTVVQMVNHGQVILGSTWSQAIRRGTFFELAAWMASRGVPLRTIPQADADALRAMTRGV